MWNYQLYCDWDCHCLVICNRNFEVWSDSTVIMQKLNFYEANFQFQKIIPVLVKKSNIITDEIRVRVSHSGKHNYNNKNIKLMDIVTTSLFQINAKNQCLQVSIREWDQVKVSLYYLYHNYQFLVISGFIETVYSVIHRRYELNHLYLHFFDRVKINCGFIKSNTTYTHTLLFTCLSI